MDETEKTIIGWVIDRRSRGLWNGGDIAGGVQIYKVLEAKMTRLTFLALDLYQQAQEQGARDYDPLTATFYRPVPGGLESAPVQDEGLGAWKRDWRAYPPESSIRL